MAAPPRLYPALRDLRVADAMHPGLISCSPDAPLRTAAGMIATCRVHAVLVHADGHADPPGGGAWGVVLDADLLRAAQTSDLDGRTAGATAVAPPLTVARTDALAGVAGLMLDQRVAHVLVVDSHAPRRNPAALPKVVGGLSGMTGGRRPARLAAMTTATDVIPVSDDALQAVVDWRLECLFAAGFEAADAAAVARRLEIDLHEALHLVERGCSSPTAVRILL